MMDRDYIWDLKKEQVITPDYIGSGTNTTPEQAKKIAVRLIEHSPTFVLSDSQMSEVTPDISIQ